MKQALCHPERSEGSHIGWTTTQNTLRDQRDFVRSLACARDDTEKMIEEIK
jgi:hypothetical protein